MKATRRKILLLFASLVAALALWLLFKKDEPKYQGKTAREWFNAAGKKQVSWSEYKKALEVLSTNFLPEFIAYGQGRYPTYWFMHWLSFMPLSFREKLIHPDAFFQFGHLSYEAMAFLGQTSKTEDSISQLKESLRNTAFAHQERMLGFYYVFTKGNLAIEMGGLSEFSKHSEFSMRFCEAHCLVRIPNAQIKREELVPVLVEAITNSALMKDIFGANSEKWQKNAYESLRALSPESATNYQRYIKQ